MKIVCISDTHEQLREVDLPKGDILIHAGDLTNSGEVSKITRELNVLASHGENYKKIIVIPGNHDFGIQNYYPQIKDHADSLGLILLNNSGITFEGINIYGMPYTPTFGYWAFMEDRMSQRMKNHIDAIPEDTNLLITHGPPKNILDTIPPRYVRHGESPQVGCELLALRLADLKDLKLHVFGHIHHSYGLLKQDGVIYVNVATCTEAYKPTNKPIVVDL